MNATDVKDALRRRHGQRSGEWVCIEEAFCGFSTYSGGIDLLAIGAWRTATASGLTGDSDNPLVAYEVKVSRSDMRRELYGAPSKNAWRRGAAPFARKQAFALTVCDYLLFATPAGLLKPDEIGPEPTTDRGLYLPEGCGLIEVGADGKCRVKTKATRLTDPQALTRHQIAELIRHAVDPNRLRQARIEIAGLADHRDRLVRRVAVLEQELADARPRERVA